jgi:hypothetical protein
MFRYGPPPRALSCAGEGRVAWRKGVLDGRGWRAGLRHALRGDIGGNLGKPTICRADARIRTEALLITNRLLLTQTGLILGFSRAGRPSPSGRSRAPPPAR